MNPQNELELPATHCVEMLVIEYPGKTAGELAAFCAHLDTERIRLATYSLVRTGKVVALQRPRSGNRGPSFVTKYYPPNHPECARRVVKTA
jgi:hypothetical protein